jgi:hypothetical protein
MRHLTKLQRQAMYSLEGYSGKTVEVATSQYARDSREGWSPVALVPFQVLTALENKRLVEIVNKYWRGADVKVLSPAIKCDCGVEWGLNWVTVGPHNTGSIWGCRKCSPEDYRD